MCGEVVQRWVNAVVVVVLLQAVALRTTVLAKHFCPKGFANFGDSLTDTGNYVDVFPYTTLDGLDAENPPHGETFFGAPAKRFSNGRLVPDFFSLAFRKPLLDAYFATTSFNYRHGANFAVAGATAAPTASALVPFSVTPFQTANFIRFKTAANVTRAEGKICGSFLRNLPAGNPYPDWLYTIEAGGNDLLVAVLFNNLSLPTIISTRIPLALGNISVAVETLYNQSARRFLLFNVPPQGCSTIILTLLGNMNLSTDSLGCIVAINQLVSVYNAGLNLTIQGLRQKLPGATISLFDYYSANLEILQHPATYGFNPNLTFTACCGAPGVGTLNYNPVITCGHPEQGSNNCANPNEFVVWDGVHFTENFYRTIAVFALNGKFTDEKIDYASHCNLDFSKFGSKVTLSQAYPETCNNLFG